MFGMRRRGGGGPRARMKVAQALELLEAGRYDEAAAALDQLVQAGERRAVPPQRLAQALMQAGRAHLGAGRPGEALARGRRALALFAQAGQPGRAVQAARRLVAELRARGYASEADALQQEIQARMPGVPWDAPESGPPAVARRLPTHCTGCGAPIRADEVDWTGAGTAECPYCGTPLQAQ